MFLIGWFIIVFVRFVRISKYIIKWVYSMTIRHIHYSSYTHCFQHRLRAIKAKQFLKFPIQNHFDSFAPRCFACCPGPCMHSLGVRCIVCKYVNEFRLFMVALDRLMTSIVPLRLLISIAINHRTWHDALVGYFSNCRPMHGPKFHSNLFLAYEWVNLIQTVDMCDDVKLTQ